MFPQVKINGKEVEESKESPYFKRKISKPEQEDLPIKSHHEFIKTTSENKYPLGKKIEKKSYTLEEVSLHNKENDVWIIIKDKVYDVTKYLDYHPGGKSKLMLGAGKDGTSLFSKFLIIKKKYFYEVKYHPWVNAGFILEKYELGTFKKKF